MNRWERGCLSRNHVAGQDGLEVIPASVGLARAAAETAALRFKGSRHLLRMRLGPMNLVAVDVSPRIITDAEVSAD